MKRRAFFGPMASNVAWAGGLGRLDGLGHTGGDEQAFTGEFTVFLDHDMRHDGELHPATGSARALVHTADGIVRITSKALASDKEEEEPNPTGKGYLNKFAEEKLNPAAVRRLLLPGVFLSTCMTSAELQAEQDDVLDGQPVSRATFALGGHWHSDPNGDYGGEHTLQIWTGPQEWPLQTVEVERMWNKKFGHDHRRTTTIRYAIAGQRLIATRLDEKCLDKLPNSERRRLDVLTLIPSG